MDRLIDSLHQLKLKDAKSFIYIYRPVYGKNSTTLSYMLRETVEVDNIFFPPKHTVINIEKVYQFKPVFPSDQSLI